MLDCFKEIPEYSSWIKIEPLLKGWSDEKKYYIEDQSNQSFLLRLVPISRYAFKKTEYDYLNQLVNLGLVMTEPIRFGTCGDTVYTLFKWVDGEDAEQVIPLLSETRQYQLGFESGKQLNVIHSLKAPREQEDWSIRFNRKIDKKLEAYEKCPIKFPNDDVFIRYIQENRYLLNNRPQTFQHGDYHIGNLLITKDGKIGVIDFNRYDFGDPWEEFNRIVFSFRVSPRFASGQIDGYFDHKIPETFFRLLALYIAVNTISAVPWAIPYGEQEVNTMIINAKEVFESYSGFNTVIPHWYNK